ncbi:shikimate kinase [Alkalibacillus silvisoli]|uniref:Shikimate kinase n=1 Tax=Alkalibacillus silvisoli TaxID=392823 RepID=A0ABN0ZSW3_9BACI
MTSIALIGFMGSGKSTVGKMLARQLKKPFYDLDQEVINKVGMEIRDIFSKYGESYFREVESDVLSSLQVNNCIVATGGGIVESEDNQQILKSKYLTFWLKADFNTISNRLIGDKARPLWSQDRDKKMDLFNRRQLLYERSSNKVIDVNDLEIKETTDLILRYIYFYTRFYNSSQYDKKL